MPRTVTQQIQLQKRLLKWRKVLQWIGAAIMVPAVVLGITMNIGSAINVTLIPLFLAEPLLIAIGVAIIPLLGSIACTITVNKLRERNYKKSVRKVTDHINASAEAAKREAS